MESLPLVVACTLAAVCWIAGLFAERKWRLSYAKWVMPVAARGELPVWAGRVNTFPLFPLHSRVPWRESVLPRTRIEIQRLLRTPNPDPAVDAARRDVLRDRKIKWAFMAGFVAYLAAAVALAP